MFFNRFDRKRLKAFFIFAKLGAVVTRAADKGTDPTVAD
jgi:hypothetical protein